MASKYFILAAVIATVRAGVVAPVAQVAISGKLADSEFDPNPQYSFAYDVQDALTGDSKNQFETRNGDVVQGQYSLIEADGTRRIVDYTADPINGFNAVVRRTPLVAAAPVIAKVAAPIVAAPAPILAKYAAPVAAAPAFARFAAPAPAYARFAAPAPILPAPVAAAPAFARFAAPVVAASGRFVAPAPVAANYYAPSPYTAPLAYNHAAPFNYVI